MHIPRFWRRAARAVQWGPGEPVTLEAPGWSDESPEAAARVASERLERLVAVVVRGEAPGDRYLYGDRPVREPVIETLPGVDPADAVITRNAYGAAVLNTRAVAFLDIDLPDGGGAPRPSLLGRLLGRAQDPAADVLNRVRAAQTRRPGTAFRVYRTRAGLRVVALHAGLRPASEETMTLCRELGVDPLYQRLCVQHESFRARLTPKPWRIGVPRLPAVFPWRDAEAEERAAAWVRAYDGAAAPFAICEVVETVGTARVHPDVAAVLAVHDARVLRPGRPLA